MAAATYTKSGTKATTNVKLDKAVFGVLPKNHELLKSAYVAYLANGRTSAANSKTRGEVSGGGKKPWKQKGTGRARFGSSRNPIWRGGGIAFGPTGNENYSHKLHTNAKRQAIRQALSVCADDGKLIIMENLVSTSGKTADTAKLLNKIGAVKSTLLVVPDKTVQLVRATSNLSQVKLVQAKYINVYDILNADKVIMTSDAVKTVTDWLTPTAKTTVKEAAK